MRDYTYNDREVTEAAAELVNEAFGTDDAGICCFLKISGGPG